MTIIACNAPYGSGGMGQHFSEVVERSRRAGPIRYFSSGIRSSDESIAEVVQDRLAPLLFRYTPLRFSPGRKAHLANDRFDRAVARRLTAPIDSFVGFNGQAMHSFLRTRELGCRRFELIAATSHVAHVAAQHAKAREYCSVEPDWLNRAQLEKTLAEYELADLIHVGSEYAHHSFLRHGVPESKLARIDYPIDDRFTPHRRAAREGFHVVYTGALTGAKGVPVLLDAFARLKRPDATLTLVGGSSTRGMRKYLAQKLRADPRITISPGDPLPHLQRAHVYVHPSFQDGYGYAPMEALACGVPVIVTEDTGMKEHVREGVDGYVVPAGDPDALLDRLEHLAKQPLSFERRLT
jgi:glycosyltransferase involved in cell wall biosynthesis